MADVNPIDRQEIVQAALEKAFKKLAKKGAIPQEKIAQLTTAHIESRTDLLRSEIERLQAEQVRIANLRPRG